MLVSHKENSGFGMRFLELKYESKGKLRSTPLCRCIVLVLQRSYSMVLPACRSFELNKIINFSNKLSFAMIGGLVNYRQVGYDIT